MKGFNAWRTADKVQRKGSTPRLKGVYFTVSSIQ